MKNNEIMNITPPTNPCNFLALKFRIMLRCRTCLTPVKLRPSALQTAKFLRENLARFSRGGIVSAVLAVRCGGTSGNRPIHAAAVRHDGLRRRGVFALLTLLFIS